MGKTRVDVLMVEQELAATREQAKRMVMAGLVFSEGTRLDKPGMKISADTMIMVKGNPVPYVGRGGLKLEEALRYFQLDLEGRTMIDVGSSTGGFIDCALENGVELCYAIDVGYNQLAWKLRKDKRVIVMERTNFRYVTPDMLISRTPDFATVDVSFISLRLILPVLRSLLSSDSDVIILIKPQFEAGKDEVGKKGVVRDEKVHVAVLHETLQFAAECGYTFLGMTPSPITGGDGNLEFLAHLGWDKADQDVPIQSFDFHGFVKNAHAYFNNEHK